MPAVMYSPLPALARKCCGRCRGGNRSGYQAVGRTDEDAEGGDAESIYAMEDSSVSDDEVTGQTKSRT